MRNYGLIRKFYRSRRLRLAGLLFSCGAFAILQGQPPLPEPLQPGSLRNTHEFDIALSRLEALSSAPAPGRSIFAPNESGAQTTVSADELRHPLSRKARRLLGAVFSYAEKGEHTNAIATLREGMAKIPAVIPYAHGVLGVEYLRLGRNAEAVFELSAAATLFPHDAMAHSNLAVSLCLVGEIGRAEEEARLALHLNPDSEAARVLLNDIEEARNRRTGR